LEASAAIVDDKHENRKVFCSEMPGNFFHWNWAVGMVRGEQWKPFVYKGSFLLLT
jgi:hypothetical protein